MKENYEQEYQAQVQYLLGKLDGKVDTLLSNQTVWISRVEDSEKRITRNDSRITVLEAKADETKNSKSRLMSIVSLAIAAAVAASQVFKEWFK